MNSDVAGLVRLLLSIAPKWEILAAALKLPHGRISRLSTLPGDEEKLERVIQLWWQANRELKWSDLMEMLKIALGNSNVGAGYMAAEVWKGIFISLNCIFLGFAFEEYAWEGGMNRAA
jgi:hypothetical protein